MNPFASFFIIHFEVGGDIWSLEHQKAFWPSTIGLIDLANQYNVKLTLQFNPQWAEYILKDRKHLSIIRKWQKTGHEIGLHHHGYDHKDWNGYTNRTGKELDPRFRGRVKDLMEIMMQLVGPYQLFTGTISDDEFDYPEGLRYDTEGIRIYHAKSRPKWVTLGGKKMIQVGMAYLSFEGNIKSFKREYQKSTENEVFGVVTHEKDFAKNPEIFEEWLKFIKSKRKNIETVSEIIAKYQKKFPIPYDDNPLTFLKDVMGSNN
jgi:hypothetical protein